MAGRRVRRVDFNFGVARHLPDGSVDTSFGCAGKTRTDFGNPFNEPFAVALQSDGNIVAAGRTGNNPQGTTDFALARYQGGSEGTGSCPAPGPSPGGTGGQPGGSGSFFETPSISGSASAGAARVSRSGALTLNGHAVDCAGPGPDCQVNTSTTGSVPSSTAAASARRRKLGASSFSCRGRQAAQGADQAQPQGPAPAQAAQADQGHGHDHRDAWRHVRHEDRALDAQGSEESAPAGPAFPVI